MTHLPRSRPKTCHLGAIPILLVLVACGGSPRALQPTHRPTGVVVADFLTGIEAIRLATERVPGATGLYSISVTFPRSEGRSEFWTIDLAHPSNPGAVSRVQIQGKRVVTVTEAPAPPGAVPVGSDRVQVDSSDAVLKAESLPWFKQGDEVTLAPEVLRVGDDGAGAARGRPFWHLIVVSASDQRELRGALWIATDNNEILYECHPPDVPC